MEEVVVPRSLAGAVGTFAVLALVLVSECCRGHEILLNNHRDLYIQ
jgi:hypothetical protein